MQMDFNGSYGSATRNMADTITPLDRIDFGNIERFNIIGTKRDDNITTGAGNDTVKSGAGNDNLSAGAGNDSLDGGAGNDSIFGGSGIDSLDGGSGKDTLTLDLSSQTTALRIANYLTSGISITGVVRAVNFEAFNIYTGSGNDTVTQSGVVNSLIIRSDDYINTGAGNDTINLGLGTTDNVNGGAGDDQLTIDYSLGDTGSGMQMDFNGSYGSATRNMADTSRL